MENEETPKSHNPFTQKPFDPYIEIPPPEEMDEAKLEDVVRGKSPWPSTRILIESIVAPLYHVKIIDIGISKTIRFFMDYRDFEDRDEYTIQGGMLSHPRIYVVEKTCVTCLARMPHTILQEIANSINFRFHIGIKDYINLKMHEMSFDKTNRKWTFDLKDSTLTIPPQQLFFAEIEYPAFREDIEPFRLKVSIEGKLGREVI